MRFLLLFLLLCTFLVPTAEPPPAKPRLLIAFASFKERRQHPRVYFYEHDGTNQGKVLGAVDAVNQRSDYHPSLSRDGRYCAFASELENQVGKLQVWDVVEKKLLPVPKLNDSPNAQMYASLSGDASLLAFAAWNRPGGSPRWDVYLCERTTGKLLDLPGLNSPATDERFPALTADGGLLAYTTNSKEGAGLSDIFLYDRKAGKSLKLAEMNSPHFDAEPSLSADGNLIAFVSDRPGGQGGRDVYLFDRQQSKFLPLAGLNSAAHEQTPGLSPDGRYLVFVSERIAGEGERDVFLYDRQAQKLLPTPGLNSIKEDFDPCVIVRSE